MTAVALPPRIQRRRARGWRMPEGAVYVGRPSLFGNPFAHADRAIATRMFRVWLTGGLRTLPLFDCRKVLPGRLAGVRREILAELPQLRGRPLACWCPPGPCHADVLIELANAGEGAP